MFNKKKSLSIIVWIIFVSTLFLGFSGYIYSASGEPANSKPVAEVMINSNGINFLPKVNYEQIILTVSRPDGTVLSKTFDTGAVPYLDLSSIYGDNSCDGSYTYELRVTPQGSKKTRNLESSFEQGQNAQNALTQAGHFMIQGGAILTGRGSEGPAVAMDVVHADDVIITGSLCIGYDCATNGTESFGADTIKMKENTMRIFFDDTSASAGFPANDWRIVVNDSTSGGGNYFAVEDTTEGSTPFKIEAGAPSSALYVDDAGRIGIGTATPIYNLNIVYGDSPTVRLHQDTSYGWTEQKWDISGNESNFFIRDGTNGSKLPFRIQPNTPTNTLTMKSDGNVGIGTWSPEYALEIDRTGVNSDLVVKRTDGAANYINATDSYANFGSITNHPLRLVVNSAWKMRINADGSITMSNGATLTAGGAWTDASSRILKENIKSLSTDEALDTLNNLSPVKYNYKADKAEKHVGFIAEDAPELVATKDRKGMSPMDVVAVLTKVLQEQQKSIREQKDAIQTQQKTISELKNRISELEKK